LSQLPAKLERTGVETDRLDELVIEAVSEQELREARERRVARLRLLWASRRFLIRSTAWGLVLGVVIAFLIPKRYQATAQLMPPDQESGTGAAMLAALSSRVGGGLASMAQGALGMRTTGDLFVGILKSDSVRDELIQKFSLLKVYHDRYATDARKDLAEHTDISEDQKSGIITVTVTDHDPRRSAAMTAEYVRELNWMVNHQSTSSAHRERIFLDQRLEQVKGDLESAEQQFSRFASQNHAIDIPTQGKAMVEAAATLQGELIAAEAELQSLRQIYMDDNARVRSAQARVSELQGALQRIGGTNATDESSAKELYPSLRELPLLGVTYADLLRRTKVEEAMFETLTQEDELAKVEEAREIPSVRLLDAPDVPQKKSFPPRLLITCLVASLAMVLSAAWILIDSSWKKVESADPRKSLAIEVWSDLRGSLRWSSRNGSSSLSENKVAHQIAKELGGEEPRKTGQAE
jgi:uncharacterized protein involved in exopolysaccharide biosynthesis